MEVYSGFTTVEIGACGKTMGCAILVLENLDGWHSDFTIKKQKIMALTYSQCGSNGTPSCCHWLQS